MKKKFRWNWYYFALGVMLLFSFIFFFHYIAANIDPAGHNWRLEYLKEGEAVDAYLHEPDVIIALIFGIFATLFFVAMLLDLIFRKHSSHILLVEIGTLGVAAYEITRAIYCFSLGSVKILVGIIYLIALVGTVGTLYFYLKKALDGDHLGMYWAFLLISIVAFFFAGATNDSYSILNAYTHNGDFSYWFGYGASRLMLLVLGLCAAVNLKFDYAPKEEKKPVEAK